MHRPYRIPLDIVQSSLTALPAATAAGLTKAGKKDWEDSFHSDTLGQVAWSVHVAAAQYGHVVREQL